MKTFSSLLPEEIVESCGNAEIFIKSVAFDSRRCEPGALFVALSGTAKDGSAFIADALANGAVAIVTEDPLENISVPAIRVRNARRALSSISKAFFDHPSKQLTLVGITGTKGKTTSTYLTQAILKRHYGSSFRFGTIEHDLGFAIKSAKNTTPESLELCGLMHDAIQHRVRAGVMEVSSHALKTFRVEDLMFAAAGFTNLSLEHTEFHPDMEDYFQAKRRLFIDLLPKSNPSVVGVDDSFGVRLARELKCAGKTVKTISVTDHGADFHVEDLCMMSTSSSFCIAGEGRKVPCLVHLPGPFNVFNALLSAALGRSLEVPWETITSGLNDLKQVPGRFESIPNDRGLTVIVDYAHSPASLENVLLAVRAMTSGRVISVFGCGGNRSPDKRPIMGRLSASLADITIVTSDNPRREVPEAIVAEILGGISALPECQKHEVHAEVDRRKAIEKALSLGQPGDVVLIAGKGHETGQIFADKTIPFDDREVAREILQEKAGAHV